MSPPFLALCCLLLLASPAMAETARERGARVGSRLNFGERAEVATMLSQTMQSAYEAGCVRMSIASATSGRESVSSEARERAEGMCEGLAIEYVDTWWRSLEESE